MNTFSFLPVTTAAFVAFSTLPALAGTAAFDDAAGVLAGSGQSRVQEAASRAPFNVRIITRNNLTDKSAVDQLANQSARSGGDNTVAIAVDTKLRHLHTGAQNAYVTIGEIDDAQRLAGAKFKTGDWPGGMVAAIDSLSQASSAKRGGSAAAATTTKRAGSSSSSAQPATTPPTSPQQTSKGFPWGWIALGVIAFIVLRGIMSRRASQARRYNPYNNAPPPPPGAGGYNQPDAPNQRGGFGGALGGALAGTALGGMLGYGLGRASADHDPHAGAGTGNAAGGWGGEGASGDPGGFVEGHSSSGDFGDSAGSSFGETGGADFGDFGGGGGGDFGGGGSGDF